MPGEEVSLSRERQRTDRQTESKTERARARGRVFLTARVCLDVLHSAPLPQAEGVERGMSLQEGDKLTMKSRGRSRGWLSATRERDRERERERERDRERVVGESF